MNDMNKCLLFLATVAYCSASASSADTYVKLRVQWQLGQQRELHATFYLTPQYVRIEDDFVLGGTVVSICDGKHYFVVDDKHHEYSAGRIKKHQVGWLNVGLPKNANRTGVTVDYGERKAFFGYTARHLVTTYKVPKSSRPDTTVDGWYIDVPAPSMCLQNWGPPFFPVGSGVSGQRSSTIPVAVQFTETSHRKTKFPDGKELDLTQTLTLETLELSQKAFDLPLFKVPAGYKHVKHMRLGSP